MSNYLEEAAQMIRDAGREMERVSCSLAERHRLRLQTADAMARLAAIERGILPPEWLADLIQARDKETGDEQ